MDSLRRDLTELTLWPGRVRRRRKWAALFHPVCWAARLRWRYDPRVERYTDGIEWLARVGAEEWVVGERLWSGWPDPPEFAFFAFDKSGALVCAWDFDAWPRAWSRGDMRRCFARLEAEAGDERDGARNGVRPRHGARLRHGAR